MIPSKLISLEIFECPFNVAEIENIEALPKTEAPPRDKRYPFWVD